MKQHLEVLRSNWLSLVILVVGVGLFGWLNAPPAETVSAPNGSIRFCSDCQQTSPCMLGGSGAMAIRLSGEWDCAKPVPSGRYLWAATADVALTSGTMAFPAISTATAATATLPLGSPKVGECLRIKKSGESYWGMCE